MAEFQQQNGFGVFHDACLAVERYVASCEKAVSNFDGSSYKKQASCLCYDDNNKYDPDTWDNAVATCVSTGQSAHPTIWSALEKNSGAIGLCTKFADAAATGPATTGPAPTDALSAATGDASPGTTAGGDSPTPTETSSAVSSPTGSSKQSSTATRSSAAAATTSSAAAPSVGEASHAISHSFTE
jgi:hypothetical protein